MFLDIIPFDNCRYIFDWLPTPHLVSGSLRFCRNSSSIGTHSTRWPKTACATILSISMERMWWACMKKVLPKRY